MANDLCIYRARIGCFYNRAVNNHDKVVFSKLSVISFYILCCMRNHNRVTIALFFFLFAEQTTAVENTGHSTSRCFHSEPQENRLQLSSLSSSLLQLLLLRSGDIESNPGPTPNYEIKITHLNARSIPKHISDIETECNKYDIITCSETWLVRIILVLKQTYYISIHRLD